ncbi:hypothetical protein [Polyangium jinanense]|uniref:Uncharacterized protein n=1 Tax=Polyangium jinanense TaxID=2829994 RepID=A0A9X4AST0_9BACT|nr:hypothetical protein [Polyangium jinanense]MDC3981455.1 hypothetical protein [Polyangium jinanense]
MLRVRLFFAAGLATAATVASLVASGCWFNDMAIGSDCPPDQPRECCLCPWPEDCPDGAPPTPPECVDGGTEAGDGSLSSCTDGTCVVPAPDWDPVFLAEGAEISVPVCPENAPEIAFEGRPAPAWGLVCPTCSCDEPVGGACHVPTTWTVTSDACTGGGVQTNFDPPADWEGTCSATNSIPEGLQCGGVPCVGGILISAPTIEEPPCTPRGSDPPPEVPHFAPGGFAARFARACARTPWTACEGADEVCLPRMGAPFATCVMHEGDETCPEGWPDKHLLYGEVDDQRQCEACSCEPPTGATCSVKVHVYSEAACTTERLAVDISPEMGGGCHLLMSGVALAGIAAEVLDYQPGTCEPHGSEPVGDVFLTGATTFCCREPVS